MKKNNIALYITMSAFLLPSLYYWLKELNWSIDSLTLYTVFPVLGLLAFTIMWFHLMTAWYRKYNPAKFDYKKFFRITSNIVLALIILHPAMLIFKAASLGEKYFEYAGQDNIKFVIFGTLALIIFLTYEVIERARDSQLVKNNWPFVVALNRIGMVMIFAHGLRIGQHLQSGYLRILWYFYGLTLILYIVQAIYSEAKPKANIDL